MQAADLHLCLCSEVQTQFIQARGTGIDNTTNVRWRSDAAQWWNLDPRSFR